MATVKEVIEKAYAKVNGEYEIVAEASDDWRTYLNALNQVMEQWADTPYVKWQTLFDLDYTLPETVEADKLTYAIPDAVGVVFGNTPFDHVFFIDGDGVVVDKYKVADQAMFEATEDQRVVALLAGNLQMKSVPDKLVGTTIRLPAYIRPAIYTAASQTVIIDSITWLVTAMAAFICDPSPVPFIARNADKFHKQAEIYMKTMRENNRKTQSLIIKRLNSGVRYTWADVMQIMTMKDL